MIKKLYYNDKMKLSTNNKKYELLKLYHLPKKKVISLK